MERLPTLLEAKAAQLKEKETELEQSAVTIKFMQNQRTDMERWSADMQRLIQESRRELEETQRELKDRNRNYNMAPITNAAQNGNYDLVQNMNQTLQEKTQRVAELEQLLKIREEYQTCPPQPNQLQGYVQYLEA